MAEKTTIYEIAKKVGVSTATVSRVLNDSPRVSDNTKKRILKAMREMNYAPRLTARKLASSKPELIGVIVPSFTTPYFNEVLKGIKDEISRTDLDMMIYNTGSDNPDSGLREFFSRGIADALIVLSIDLPDKINKQLQATDVRTVLVNTTHPDYSYFQVNDYRGGQLAAEHLATQGYDSIGIISAAEESTMAIERTGGFVDYLNENGIKVKDEHFVRGSISKHAGFSEEAGFEAIHKFHEQGDYPEAIFCLNDTLAVGAIYALSRLGMKVPDDIAVMGYDNIKLSKYLDLTTIDQKMYTIGVNAIKQMTRLIDESDAPVVQEVTDPVLVKRGSTEKPT
ncbi:MAG: LacI family DNA-binding transcriptional regulator [Bacteroidota bacterium]